MAQMKAYQIIRSNNINMNGEQRGVKQRYQYQLAANNESNSSIEMT